MALQTEGLQPEQDGWTIQRAEDLLSSLPGILSVRIVARPGGEIEEIHLLTTTEVSAKQTVRNVESALKAKFHLEVDHRKISVAQTDRPSSGGAIVLEAPVQLVEPDPGVRAGRILFVGHRVDSERSHRVRVRVTVEWHDQRF